MKSKQELYDYAHSAASEVIRRGMQQMPMMAAVLEDGEIAIAPCHNLPKDALAHLHLIVSRADGVRFVVLVMEAWVMEANTDDAGTRRILELVSQGRLSLESVPRRSEAVIFILREGAAIYMATCKIDRAGNALEKAALEEVDNKTTTGRFVKRGG